ncbi:MAG: C1 family peptidase [Chitinophagaceae bacterium]
MRLKKVLLVSFLLTSILANAQVDLMNRVIQNKSDQSTGAFQFTTLVNNSTTPVQNQANSGTCWSYSTNSFLESEMMKEGRKPVRLSELFSARNAYMDKAVNYVRMHGSLNWGDGGEPHDVINMLAKYGALPYSVYTGLNYGTKLNDFGEFDAVTKAFLDAVISDKNGTLSTAWKVAFSRILDSYLGVVPKTFEYEGKQYTPQTFAQEVVGLNPKNYVEFISQTNTPYFKKATMMVPDNWTMQRDFNIPMKDMTKIVDYALNHGYTVSWGTDISEKYFSWKNGVAYVPAIPYSQMTPQQRATMFDGPKPQKEITPQIRQLAFDDYATTDDHGMHITGIAKDQNGTQYYIVKNSWGTGNEYKGYLYVSKTYFQYKTTSFLVNKKGIPEDLKKKLGI